MSRPRPACPGPWAGVAPGEDLGLVARSQQRTLQAAADADPAPWAPHRVRGDGAASEAGAAGFAMARRRPGASPSSGPDSCARRADRDPPSQDAAPCGLVDDACPDAHARSEGEWWIMIGPTCGASQHRPTMSQFRCDCPDMIDSYNSLPSALLSHFFCC